MPILLIALLLLFSPAAFAQQTEGVGGAFVFGRTSVGTGGDHLTMTSSGATAQRFLFPAGGKKHNGYPITLSVSGAGSCFYAARPQAISAGAGGLLYAGRQTLDGASAGVRFDAAGSIAFQIPDLEWLVNDVGAALGQKGEGDVSNDAVGLCTGGTVSPYGVALYEPCVVSGDCSSGSCDESPTAAEWAQAGVYLYCVADASTINVAAWIERLIVR